MTMERKRLDAELSRPERYPLQLPEFLTLDQATRALNCKVEQVQRLIASGWLRLVIQRGRSLIPAWCVLNVLQQVQAEADRLNANGYAENPNSEYATASIDENWSEPYVAPTGLIDSSSTNCEPGGVTAGPEAKDHKVPQFAEPEPIPATTLSLTDAPPKDGEPDSVTANVPALLRFHKCTNPLSPNECDGVTAKEGVGGEPPGAALSGCVVHLPLDELTAALKRFLFLPPHAAEAIALWIVHTYALDAADHTPRLNVESPEKRCGKTSLLSLLDALVSSPLSASNITGASAFRIIEKQCPTLLIDEADTFLEGNELMRGVLNAGHSRSHAFVIRCDGEENEPRRFSTWAAVAIAHIGRFPKGFSTVDDRSIRIEMERKPRGVRLERLNRDRLNEIKSLAQKIVPWVNDNLDLLKKADPKIPEEFDDRAADNWRPLLAIADAAGGYWPQRARESAAALSQSRAEKDGSIGTMLLTDIRDIFEQRRTDRLGSEELCNELGEMQIRPWGEWSRGKPITPTKLARLLDPFKIKPGTVRFGDKTSKGYTLEQFKKIFERYLPPKREPLPDGGVSYQPGAVTTSQSLWQ
jgi:hypothetical protein